VRRVGEHHTVELDLHMARRRQDVDARVRAARVDDHFLVLFEPRVHRGPIEADRVAQFLERRIGVLPCRVLALDVVDLHREVSSVTAAR
jgi:hypothetical protein